MTPPRELLVRLPAPACRWHLLQRSGFSGAHVWRGELDGQSMFALKRDIALLPEQIFEWWRHLSSLPFIPTLHTTFEHNYVRWTLAAWMPGNPVRTFEPHDPRLDSACSAILQVHDVLNGFRVPDGPIPAIRRRIDTLQTWSPNGETGFRGTAAQILQHHRQAVIGTLLPWRDRAMPRQPCLVDVRADHILYTGNDVTGIVDFGAMKFDHVAVDAARYLGETCQGHGKAFQRGCELFARHHGTNVCPPELVELLDRSGTLGAMAFWLKEPPCPEADARLVRLIERWHRMAAEV